MTEPTEQAILRAMAWVDEHFPDKTLRYRNSLAAQWLRGYYGEPNPYSRRGGNFAAGYRNAYGVGEDIAQRERESNAPSIDKATPTNVT